MRMPCHQTVPPVLMQMHDASWLHDACMHHYACITIHACAGYRTIASFGFGRISPETHGDSDSSPAVACELRSISEACRSQRCAHVSKYLYVYMHGLHLSAPGLCPPSPSLRTFPVACLVGVPIPCACCSDFPKLVWHSPGSPCATVGCKNPVKTYRQWTADNPRIGS